MKKYFSPIVRACFFLGLIFISSGMRAKEVDTPKGDYSQILVGCENLARRRSAYIPEDAVVICVGLLKNSHGFDKQHQLKIRKIVQSIFKKIFIKAQAIEHLDSALSSSLKETISIYTNSDPILKSLVIKDPYLKWTLDYKAETVTE